MSELDGTVWAGSRGIWIRSNHCRCSSILVLILVGMVGLDGDELE